MSSHRLHCTSQFLLDELPLLRLASYKLPLAPSSEFELWVDIGIHLRSATPRPGSAGGGSFSELMSPFDEGCWIVGDQTVDCFVDPLLDRCQVVAETSMQIL